MKILHDTIGTGLFRSQVSNLLSVLAPRSFTDEMLPRFLVSTENEAGSGVFVGHDFESNEIRVTDPNGLPSPEVLSIILARVAAIRRARKHFYTLHCSAVSKGGQVILFFGTPHSGKTTIAIMMHREFGWEFCSSNMSLISDNARLVGGTSMVTIRPTINDQMITPLVTELVSVENDSRFSLRGAPSSIVADSVPHPSHRCIAIHLMPSRQEFHVELFRQAGIGYFNQAFEIMSTPVWDREHGRLHTFPNELVPLGQVAQFCEVLESVPTFRVTGTAASIAKWINQDVTKIPL